jgi:hypothetical protein
MNSEEEDTPIKNLAENLKVLEATSEPEVKSPPKT